jgi:hypothetical protein
LISGEQNVYSIAIRSHIYRARIIFSRQPESISR